MYAVFIQDSIEDKRWYRNILVEGDSIEILKDKYKKFLERNRVSEEYTLETARIEIQEDYKKEDSKNEDGLDTIEEGSL